MIPKVLFNNGKSIPILGLGTWKSEPRTVTEAVINAINCGYRAIDCAYIYSNEAEVGAALKAKIEDGTVRRDELFITSKEGGQIFPVDDNGKFQYSSVDYLESWSVMEDCVDDGLIKSIGLSNFNKKQLQRILDNSRIKPTNLQVECHPFLRQDKLIDFCKSEGITVTASSPLGSPNRPWAKSSDPHLLTDKAVLSIAESHNKTPAQILIRYQIQRGVIVIPKSVTLQRIEENFRVFDFELTSDDMNTLNSFTHQERFLHLDWVNDHPYFPFCDED